MATKLPVEKTLKRHGIAAAKREASEDTQFTTVSANGKTEEEAIANFMAQLEALAAANPRAAVHWKWEPLITDHGSRFEVSANFGFA